MSCLRTRLPIALAIISALCVAAPTALAADPGTVEFNPGGPTQYLPAAPTVDWSSWGAFSGATCQFSKVSAPTSTTFPTASCSAAIANAPVVNSTSAPTLTTYLWNTTPLVSGDGKYRVTYTPAFTSVGTITATRDFVIDSVNPDVTASAPNGVSTDNTPEVGYSVLDVNPNTVICAVDPVVPIVPPTFAGFAPCPASPYTLPTLSDGDHNFFVVAQDKTGNYGYALRNFTIDATGPQVTITGLTEGEVVTSAWPPLSVSSTDPGSGVLRTTCSYDADAASFCGDANFLNTPLPDGPHALKIIATDVIGNVTNRLINFTIDTSGGLRQGLVAPKTAKFLVKRGKLKGTKYATTFTVAFALAPEAPTTGCSGSAKLNVLVKKKQIGSASAKLKLTGGRCVATAAPKISKKFKGKKLSLTFAYKSGPIKAFTLYGTGKL